LFLPFIDLLQARLDILAMPAGVDHRLMRLSGRPIWLAPDDSAAAQAMDDIFAGLAGRTAPGSATLDVAGRPLAIPIAAGRICRFGFAELCGAALGPADYLALASRFAVIMVDHVPLLTAERRNETLRFIALVDQVYEKRRLLVASAVAEINLTCAADSHYAVQYRRAASRLHEMQSADYISQTIAS
jgi:cell division protein ZapE